MDTPKNIHFFIGQLNIGGIETYLFRISKELHEKGIIVYVWVSKNDKDAELDANLSKYATVNYIGRFNRLSLIFIKTAVLPINTDLVVAMGQTALLSAMRACAKLNRPVKLVVGVFSQWEFVSNINIYRNNTAMAMFQKLSPSNIFFCTEGCRNDHAKFYTTCVDSKISPLLIDIPNNNKSSYRTCIKNNSVTRITSIGRITPFKTYNYQMPYIIKSLIDKGYLIHWNVYGDGPKYNDLKNIIFDLGMEQHITLHGTLLYSQMLEKLSESDLYIGAGTSIIEASAAGIPTIVSLDDSVAPLSPGFFCNRNGFFTSDTQEQEKTFPIEDLIIDFINLNIESQLDLSKKSQERANIYSTQHAKKEYTEIYKNAQPIKIDISKYFTVLDIYSLIIYFLKNKALPIRNNHN